MYNEQPLYEAVSFKLIINKVILYAIFYIYKKIDFKHVSIMEYMHYYYNHF